MRMLYVASSRDWKTRRRWRYHGILINYIIHLVLATWGYSSVVERSLCMREASGSNPDISTPIFFFFLRFSISEYLRLLFFHFLFLVLQIIQKWYIIQHGISEEKKKRTCKRSSKSVMKETVVLSTQQWQPLFSDIHEEPQHLQILVVISLTAFM